MPLLWKPARPVTGVEKEVDRSENLMGYLPICQLPPLAEAKDVMILNVKTVHYRTTNKNEAFCKYMFVRHFHISPVIFLGLSRKRKLPCFVHSS